MKIFYTLSLLSFLHLPSLARQSDDSSTVYVEFLAKISNPTTGILIRQNKDSIVLESNNRLFTYRKPEIKDMRAVSERYFEKSKDLLHPGRYLFSKPALPTEEGSLYYENTYVLFHGIHFSPVRNFSIGGGTDIIPGEKKTYYLNTRYNFYSRTNRTYGFSASLFRLPDSVITSATTEESMNFIFSLSASATIGNLNHHFTVGASYLFLESIRIPPVLSISGATRLHKNISPITENRIFWKTLEIPAIISYGARFNGKKGMLDLCFLNTLNSGIVGIPYIGYTRRMF